MAAETDLTGGTPIGVHPVLAALAGVRAAVVVAHAGPWWSPSDAEVVAAIGQVLAARSSLDALAAALVGQAESRGIRHQLGQDTTAGWLRRRYALSRGAATHLTALAAELPRWGQVEAALRAGQVSAEAAAAVTAVLNHLPGTATADELTRAEELLVTQAVMLDPAELAVCGQALKEALTVTADTDDPAQAQRIAKEAADAAATEATAWNRRSATLTRRRDGSLGITATLDPVAGAQVREILEAAARPTDAVEGIRDPDILEDRTG